MRSVLLQIVSLLILINSGNGQVQLPNISLKNYQNDEICVFSEQKIAGSVTGSFGSNNKFRFELLSPSNREVLSTADAVYEDGHFTFVLSDDLDFQYSHFYGRIVASAPQVNSNEIMYRSFKNRGTLALMNASSQTDTLNAGRNLLLNLTASTNNPVTVTLNDSTKLQVMKSTSGYSIPVPSKISQELFIVSATNSCNVPVPFSGKASVVINSISTVTGKIRNAAVCEGSNIELTYSTLENPIPASARFKLRFEKTDYTPPNESKTFEIPATRLQEGLLTAVIPDQAIRYSRSYRVAIVVENPNLVTEYSERFVIHEKARASFRGQNDVAVIGEDYTIYFDVTGPAPYTIELNNGNTYLLDQNLIAKVAPTHTESFEIKSLKTACGTTSDLARQKITLTVAPGIAFKTQPGQTWSICEKETLRLPFVGNVPFSNSTRFIAEGITQAGKSYQFDARLVNDSIEFVIPLSPAEWQKEGYFDIKSFRIKTVNPSFTSAYIHGFTIKGVPRVSYDTYESTTLPYPGYLSYNLIVTGGAPYTAIDYSGSKIYADHSTKHERVYVSNSGNFAPKSVENGCYSTTEIPPLRLSATPYSGTEPTIVVHPPTSRYVCSPDSIEIGFDAFGKFGDDNMFQILIPGSNEVWRTVRTPGRFKIPASVLVNRSYPNVIVKSTSPAKQGIATLPILLDDKPKLVSAESIGGISPEQPLMYWIDQKPSINLHYDQHSPYTAVFSDGIRDYHFTQRSQYDQFSPPLERSKVTPYVIKSMTNACGTTEQNKTVYLFWQSARITLRGFQEGKTYCSGEEMVVPFDIENGSVPLNTEFHLQITKDFVTYQTVSKKNKIEDFSYLIPDSLEAGEYFVQVKIDDFTYTGASKFVVKKRPTAELTVSSNSGTGSHQIRFSDELKISYNLTGGGHWDITENNSGNLQIEIADFQQHLLISKGTSFKLRSVSNSCGYGSVSGDFHVSVRPEIIKLTPKSTSICNGNDLVVDYSIVGDIPEGEKAYFSITDIQGVRHELASTTNPYGTIQLPISEQLTAGRYELSCRVAGIENTEPVSVTIGKSPSVEIMGNATINPGDFTFIYLRPRETGSENVTITLSDGKVVETYMASLIPQAVRVEPAVTTTYTILSGNSGCGSIASSGSATVFVNPPSDRTVKVTGLNKIGSICSNDTILVYFSQTGFFSPDNNFSIQLLDEAGTLKKSFGSLGKTSPLQLIVTDDLSVNTKYRIRIVPSDPGTYYSDYQVLTGYALKSSASFSESVVYKDDAGKAEITVKLEGTGPWQYLYGNDLGETRRFSLNPTDKFEVSVEGSTAYFMLKSVTNECGTGTLKSPSTIRVEVILGTDEPLSEAGIVSIGPNPTSDFITINFSSDHERILVLYDARGILVWEQKTFSSKSTVPFSHYPSGTYFLNIIENSQMKNVKIIKR